MEIKITEGRDFLDAYNVLKNKSLPIKTAYTIAKIAKKIQEDVDFYNEKFQDIIKEYGQFDENGNPIYTEGNHFIKIIEGKEEECQKKIAELEGLIIKLDIEPIKLDDLGEIEIDSGTIRKLLSVME